MSLFDFPTLSHYSKQESIGHAADIAKVIPTRASSEDVPPMKMGTIIVKNAHGIPGERFLTRSY